MATKMLLGKDVAGNVDYSIYFSDYCFRAILTEDILVSLGTLSECCGNFYDAIFSYTPGSTVWVSSSPIEAVTGTNEFFTTLAQLNPTVRRIKKGEGLYFLSTGINPVEVGVALYAVDR